MILKYAKYYSEVKRAKPIFVPIVELSMIPVSHTKNRVGGNRSKERDRKSELVLRSTYQIFEWDRNNSGRTFYKVVRYVHIPLVP